MNFAKFGSFAVAALTSACLLSPAPAQTRRSLNINVAESAQTCADVTVRSDGEVARADETFTLTKAEAATLELTGIRNGNIRARGWDRSDYQVAACKIAMANDRAGAESLLNGITVTRAGARITSDGPSAPNTQWLTVFIVNAPRGAALDLQTTNGPIDARGIEGSVKVKATNGPVSIRDCSGAVNADAINGPVTFAGSTGEVHLHAKNGPVSVSVPNDVWNGSELTAQADNGPVSADVPATFKSALRIETSGHSPLRCSIDACRGMRPDPGNGVLEVNGTGAKLRFSTSNGPVSVGPKANRAAREI